jgi:hypothetical protein
VKALSYGSREARDVYFQPALLVLSGASACLAQEASSTVINKAKKKAVAYTTMSLSEVQGLSAIFEKQYPPIRVEVSARGPAAHQSVQAEFNAKSYLSRSSRAWPIELWFLRLGKEASLSDTSPSSSSYQRSARQRRLLTSVYQNTVLAYNRTL